MKKIICSIAAIVVLSACTKSKAPEVVQAKDEKAQPANADRMEFPAGSPKLSRLKVEEVVNGQVPTEEVVAPGKVEANPNRVSHVLLPVAGRVVSVSVKLGDFVRQGQSVLTIESPDIDTAISTLRQADASVTQARAALAKSQSDMDRVKDLFEHKAMAQKEVVNAEAVLAQNQAAVEQALASVSQAKRRLEILGVHPGQYGQRVDVRAPISGKVLEMVVAAGEFRNDLSASLITIADLSTVWVTSEVPETSIRLIQLGERIDVEFSAYPNEKFRGRVAQIADVVDPQTRTIKVRAELDNRHGRLRPEMFGRIRHVEGLQTSAVVPSAAVLQEEGRNIVWQQTSNTSFRRVSVELGNRVGDQIAVKKGLQAGDRVVTDGVMLLK